MSCSCWSRRSVCLAPVWCNPWATTVDHSVAVFLASVWHNPWAATVDHGVASDLLQSGAAATVNQCVAMWLARVWHSPRAATVYHCVAVRLWKSDIIIYNSTKYEIQSFTSFLNAKKSNILSFTDRKPKFTVTWWMALKYLKNKFCSYMFLSKGLGLQHICFQSSCSCSPIFKQKRKIPLSAMFWME